MHEMEADHSERHRYWNIKGCGDTAFVFAGKSLFSSRTLRANIFETPVVLLINEQGEKEKGRDEREFSWCLVF
jgi:hypothetical protein